MSLFDHLIGSRKQFVWDSESERLGGLEIDDQLKLCWRLHGEIGRLLTLEDAVDIPWPGETFRREVHHKRSGRLVPKKSD